MQKDITIAFRVSTDEHAVLKKVANQSGLNDGRGDGVSALLRKWTGIFLGMEKVSAWDSLEYLAEKMGKTPEAVISGIINARAKELLDKE